MRQFQTGETVRRVMAEEGEEVEGRGGVEAVIEEMHAKVEEEGEQML